MKPKSIKCFSRFLQCLTKETIKLKKGHNIGYCPDPWLAHFLWYLLISCKTLHSMIRCFAKVHTPLTFANFDHLFSLSSSRSTKTIFLQDNAIVQIRLQDLNRLRSLHYLYLQNNSISALEPGAFLNQGQLLELALNGNLIHLVTPDMFRGLEHLRILYLAGNQITRIQDHTFRGLQVRSC